MCDYFRRACVSQRALAEMRIPCHYAITLSAHKRRAMRQRVTDALNAYKFICCSLANPCLFNVIAFR